MVGCMTMAVRFLVQTVQFLSSKQQLEQWEGWILPGFQSLWSLLTDPTFQENTVMCRLWGSLLLLLNCTMAQPERKNDGSGRKQPMSKPDISLAAWVHIWQGKSPGILVPPLLCGRLSQSSHIFNLIQCWTEACSDHSQQTELFGKLGQRDAWVFLIYQRFLPEILST